MKKRALILSALMLTLFAVSYNGGQMGSVKAAGTSVVDNADWNKKKVTITIPNDYTSYTKTQQYTLDSVGVWQWGAKKSSGRYTVYFDAADIKQVADLYQNQGKLNIPQRYANNCALHDKTVAALR